MQNLYREEKVMKSKFVKCMTILGIAMMLSACGGETDSNKTVDNETVDNEVVDDSEVANESDFSIEDIDWKVELGVFNGERLGVFNYTNNTDYDLLEMRIEFKPKENLNDEEIALLDSLKEENDLTDEDIDELYIWGYNRQLIESGKPSKGTPCGVSEVNDYIYDMSLYETMEPNMAYISYIKDDDTLISMYYDFKLKKFSEDEVGEVYEWSDSELNSLIPRPEARVVQIGYQTEDYLPIDIYGVDLKYYLSYVEQCKEKGFTNIESEYDTSFRALNDSNISVRVSYIGEEDRMSITVEIEDETE